MNFNDNEQTGQCDVIENVVDVFFLLKNSAS